MGDGHKKGPERGDGCSALRAWAKIERAAGVRRAALGRPLAWSQRWCPTAVGLVSRHLVGAGAHGPVWMYGSMRNCAAQQLRPSADDAAGTQGALRGDSRSLREAIEFSIFAGKLL